MIYDPILHDRDTVAQANRLVEIVGDEDNGLVQHFLETQKLVLHFAANQRIEGREGLVEEPDLRLHGERAPNAHALTLAAGELSRIVVLTPFEADNLDDFAGALVAGLFIDALDFKRKSDILQHRTVR